MGQPNVLTGYTAPISVPDPVAGVLMGELTGVQNPDTVVNVLNATLMPMLLSMLLQQKYSPNTKSSFRKKYDYIIVGAGAAGCVLANRLSEKKCVSVLLLEAGKTPPVLTEIPGIARALLMTDAKWNFWTEPQEHTAGEQYQNRIPYDVGKGLGGSSLINAMLYVRGNKRDYDDWEAMGAKGWSYKCVLPYFRKLENNTDADIASNKKCHNVSGPVTCSRMRYTSDLKDAFIEAAKSLGYPVVDVNCKEQLGTADLQTFIRHGQRCSAAKAYLVPVDDRPNLDIVTEAFVTKIEITNKMAQGVYVHYKGSLRYVRANKEVIVSAGALNSPKILMLSGIGPRETLEKLKIPVHADLRVGDNLQDHVTALAFFTVGSQAPFPLRIATNIEPYLTNRSGLLASPAGVLSIGFHRSVDATTPKGVPNYEFQFTELDPSVIRLTMGLKPMAYKQLFLRYETSAMAMCFSVITNPKSRGFVTINTTDPYEDPIIDPKFLSDPQDVVDLVEGLKFCLDVAEHPQLKKLGVKPFETKMPGCEGLDNDRDKYLECYVSKFTISDCHPSCTVKMGSRCDPTAVLDPKFRVRGVKKLRVIDASAMPKVISGNPMIPVMMMAERGSDLIKKTIRCC